MSLEYAFAHSWSQVPMQRSIFNDLNLSKLVSISKSLDIFISFAVLIIVNSQQIIPECLKTIIKFYITSHGFCGSTVLERVQQKWLFFPLSCQRLQLERLEGCGDSTAGGWIIQKVFSLVSLTVDAGSPDLGCQLEYLYMGSSCGLPHSMAARFWKQMFPESLLKFYCLLLPSLQNSHNVTFLPFYKSYQFQGMERVVIDTTCEQQECQNHIVRAWLILNVFIAITGKYSLLY